MTIEIGSDVTLSASFTNQAGDPVTVGTVTLLIKQPNDVLSSIITTEVSLGTYEGLFRASRAGVHYYRFAGDGAVCEGSFTVDFSEVIGAG